MWWTRCTVICAAVAVLAGNTASAMHPPEEDVERQLGHEGLVDPTVSRTSPSLTATVPIPQTTIASLDVDGTARAKYEALETDEWGGRDSERHESEPICYAESHSKGPFCLPEDGKKMYVGEKYLVTWDPDALPVNSTVVVGLTYANDTDGKSPFISTSMPNTLGFMRLAAEKDWLDGKSHNNLTLYIAEHDPNSGKRVKVTDGPMIQLWKKGAEPHPRPEYTWNPRALAIGLPVCFLVFVVIVGGLFCCKQKSRSIGMGNIMGGRLGGIKNGERSIINRLGRRGRGHRRQRNEGGEGAAIRLADLESACQYKDDLPTISTEDEVMGPFSSARPSQNPFNNTQRSGGNAFQHNVTKLRSWR